MELLKKLKIKAVLIGLLAFIILFVLSYIIILMLMRHNIDPAGFSVIYGYASFFVCGYITGFISKEAGTLNGSIVGALTPLVSILSMLWSKYYLVNILANFFENGIFWFLIGIICCGFGGLFWDLQNMITKKTSNKRLHKERS